MNSDAFETVTLVDTDDNEIGSSGKLPAHRDGKLRRAFSILASNSKGELLLQRRPEWFTPWFAVLADKYCTESF